MSTCLILHDGKYLDHQQEDTQGQSKCTFATISSCSTFRFVIEIWLGESPVEISTWLTYLLCLFLVKRKMAAARSPRYGKSLSLRSYRGNQQSNLGRYWYSFYSFVLRSPTTILCRGKTFRNQSRSLGRMKRGPSKFSGASSPQAKKIFGRSECPASVSESNFSWIFNHCKFTMPHLNTVYQMHSKFSDIACDWLIPNHNLLISCQVQSRSRSCSGSFMFTLFCQRKVIDRNVLCIYLNQEKSPTLVIIFIK